MAIIINGKTFPERRARHSLLSVLRGELKMVGTKIGCGKGLCGACTFPLVGQAARDCQTMVWDADALRRPWTE